MQKVVRTYKVGLIGEVRNSFSLTEDLQALLIDGWKVVMCNKIGEDLEYILEKEDE